MSLFDELWVEFVRAYERRPAPVHNKLVERLAAEMDYQPPGRRQFSHQLEAAVAAADAQRQAQQTARAQARKLHGELTALATELATEIEGVTYAQITRPTGWRTVAQRLVAARTEREVVEHLLKLVPVELLRDESVLVEDLREHKFACLRAWLERLETERDRLHTAVDEAEARHGDGARAKLERNGVVDDLQAIAYACLDATDNLEYAEQEPARRMAWRV
jgi:hypothetical protein